MTVGVRAERPPLIGRDDELRELLHAVSTERRSVVLAGAAGTGKTRLQREIVAALEAGGARVSRAVATDSASTLPFGALSHLLPDRPGADADRSSVLRHAARAITADGSIVAIDDAHLLDDLSAALVHQLVTNDDATLVLTVRSGEAVSDGVSSLWKDGYAERYEVLPLSRSETELLLHAMIGGTIALRTYERVWKATHGNPLFIRETVLGALHSGALTDRTGIWVWDDDRPSTRLHDLVASRFRDVDEAERRGLELLAVGEPLSATLFAQLAGDVLVQLERRGLVIEEADGRRSVVRLVHPAYAETVRAEMSPRTGKSIRSDLVRALAATGLRRREDTLQVAKWHLESGEVADVPLLFAGYEAARHATHFDLALRFMRRLLDVEPSPAHAWRCIHLMHFLGMLAEAAPLIDLYADADGSEEDRANLALCSSVVLRDMGMADDGIAVLQRAHVELDGEWADRVLGHIAEQLWLACRYTEALAVSLPTIDATDLHPFGRAYAVSVAGLVLATIGRSTDAIEMLERVGPTIASTTTGAMSTLLHGQLRALAIDGRLDEAIAHTAAIHTWALEHGDEVSRQGSAVGLAAFHLVAGRPRTALNFARESNAILRTMNPTQSYYVGYEAEALALLGDGEAAMQAWKQAPRFREPEHPESVRQRGWIAAAQGDVQEARRLTTEAADASAAMGALNTELSALLDAVRLGAVALIERLAVVCEQCQGSHAAAARRYAEGLRRDDPDELSSASQAFEAVGRVLCAAEASAQAAISYARRGLKARAASAAARSATLADRCEGARTPILQAGPSPDPLTPRERDVVDLAREGLTSREIADRLVVSVRTVETYLQRAYAKLGVSGRHELASAALDRGSS